MAEEMMLESFPFESDEAEDWESDESIAEADESAEDIGERARRRSRRRSQYRPARVGGVRGITLRGPDGVRNVQFPTKLATAAETNRGLAGQEVARRALEGRLDRLETGVSSQQRNDSSVSGMVTLLVGGGLSIWGAVEASRRSTGFTFGEWAKQPQSQIATVASVSQIATSGAKAAIYRRYPRSPFGIAADIFSVAQIAAFAFGSLRKPRTFIIVGNKEDITLPLPNDMAGTLFLTQDRGEEYELQIDATGKQALQLVTVH
jgi:hypothetical protein